MHPRTHLAIDHRYSGTPGELAEGRATARMTTLPEMAVDERQLVHGGFVFSLADHAAMLAVNDPNVVLGAAEARFLAPVTVGEELVAEARIEEEKGRKRRVVVTVRRGDEVVVEATLTCFVLEQHVLER